MKTLTMRAFTCISISLALVALSGCQSTGGKKSNTNDLAAYAAKQQDYEQLLQEWQTLKPGISRLLAIESELNLLLGELEQLSASLAQSQHSAQVASAPAPTPVPVAFTSSTPVSTAAVAPAVINEAVVSEPVQAAPRPLPVSTVERATGGNYALQVASITEPHRLQATWRNLLDKNPQLLAELEPNYQKIQVKNTDYYRLKVGSFNTQQEASRTCSHLKSAGVSCLVVDYTKSDFAQL